MYSQVLDINVAITICERVIRRELQTGIICIRDAEGSSMQLASFLDTHDKQLINVNWTGTLLMCLHSTTPVAVKMIVEK